MMSERFSVEDILKEVKEITGEHYVPSFVEPVKKAEEVETQIDLFEEVVETKNELVEEVEAPEINVVEKTAEENQINLFEEKKEEPTDSDFYEQTKSRKSEYADLSADDFLAAINKKLSSESKEKAEIVDGFTVVTEEPEQIVAETIEEEIEKTQIIDEIKIEEKAETAETLDETVVFSKEEVLEAVVKKPQSENEEDESEVTVYKEHKPEHLLSADEIKSGEMKSSLGFRLGNKLKDLAKGENNDFAIFKKPTNVETEEPVPQIEVVQEIPEVEVAEENQEFFETLSEQYEEEQIASDNEEKQPDVLVNEIELESEKIEEIPVDEVFAAPIVNDAVDLETEVVNTSDNRFSRKTKRQVEQVEFDYSETLYGEDEVIDDYCSIEDEEAVRYDLDMSFKRVSNRLTLTIGAFILSFVVSVLPAMNIDLLPFISPTENLTGFLIANAAILVFTLIVNATGFFSGLGAFFSFRASADSALSFASILVALQSGLAFVPEFGATVDVAPFFTAGLIFAYILNLIGKKSMVMRIKANFRMVATTAIKQSCFMADEKFSEMLENDEFIGAPYTAVSKGTLNLQNYLKNSYCEDPSDNISKLFGVISLVVCAVAFAFVYFTTKDVMSGLAYACAISLLATPVCAIISVNSPIKKAAMHFRQQDGLLTSYATVKEFSDVECVVVEAEKLFPAGSVEMQNLSALGDISIEDVILKSAALTVNAGGPLADVFDKIIDGRRKMLPPVTDIVYEDGFGLTGNVDGKIVRIGNRKFMDAYGIYGLTDELLEEKAKREGLFIVYSAIEDEVCGMFILKYKSIDPDIEDAVYNLVANGVTLAIKTNDPNITPELIETVFEIPQEYVLVMEAGTTQWYDEISRPSKKADSLLAYGGRFATLANLIIACKKIETKISVTAIVQTILYVVGFGFALFCAILGKGFEFINTQNVVLYQLVVTIITMFFSSVVKRIK